MKQVSIVGGGVIGCSIALQLQKLGFQVHVLERNGEVGHGSTSASCAIVRRFYSQPEMIAMAHEAASIWAHWGAFLGPIDDDLAMFRRPGMLFLPPAMDETTDAIVTEMKKLGIRVSVLSAEQVKERFPYIDVSSHFPVRALEDPTFFDATEKQIAGAVFEEDAGYIVSPGLATLNLRLAAEREGARFLMNCEVVSIRQGEASRFQVETKDGTILPSDIVVNVAGPHSSVVNQMAGVVLPLKTRALRREVHAMVNPLFASSPRPDVPVVGDLDGGIYFRPDAGGRDILVGSADPDCEVKEWIDDPDEYLDTVTEAYRQRQCYRLMKRIPSMGLSPCRGVAALYDVTVQDWYPIADKTERPGYYVCIGTSGSSFKTSPVLGQLMAQLIKANEQGQDTDLHPLQLELKNIEMTIDCRFLSRLRGTLQTSGTVIG